MALASFPQPMSGDLFIFPWTGSAYEAAYNLYVKKFDVDSSDVDTKYRYSRKKADYGTATQTVIIPQPFKITIDLDDKSSYVAALMFRATDTALSISSGTVSDEAVTAKLDRGIQLANYPLTAASVVVTNSGGNVTYTEGTDYVVDYDAGILTVLSGGAIADAASLKVDYGHASVTGRLITGGAQTQIKAKLVLAGQELGNTSKKARFQANMVNLGPAGAYDLMSENPQVASLTGSFETVGANPPFKLETW